ncbi:MAG TPA: hypothetical protein VMU16_04265 [Candidatus Binataceae bacterium]|nr:hypothetical protein [Candidatus Binataceae bacterium]
MVDNRDGPWWLGTLWWLVGVLWIALGAAVGWIWRTIPDKRYVDNAVAKSEDKVLAILDYWKAEDPMHDRELFEDLIAPTNARLENLKTELEELKGDQIRRHEQNTQKLDQILDLLKGE